MNASTLLLSSQRPAWLRLLLTVAAVLITVVCTSRKDEFGTLVAWFVAYYSLTGIIPWLIVRSFPAGHLIRVVLAKRDNPSGSSWFRDNHEHVRIGFGLLVALFAAHGLPRGDHGGPYVLGAMYLVSGAVGILIRRFKSEEPDSSQDA